MSTPKAKPAGPKDRRTTLSECFLEHAARESAWAATHAKACEYQAAANALERRNVWLTAALIAQERKL